MALRVQHSFQGASGIAKDQYVNTFHFVGPIVTGSNFPALANAVRNFYNVAPAGIGAKPIEQWMAPMSDAPNASIKMYDTDDLPGSGPVYEEFYTPGTHGLTSNNLPSEVSCCLSYGANPEAGIPIARQRGRIYIGPLSDTCLSTAPGSTVSRPALEFRTDLLNAGVKLAADALELFYGWVVHSEAANADFAISHFWVDNAWDTQRRRGDAPNSRLTAGATP